MSIVRDGSHPASGAGRDLDRGPNPGLAVDIGGSKVAVALADATAGRIVRLPTRPELGPHALVEGIAGAARELAGSRPVERVVVASAGSLDTATGVVRWASNLPFHGFDLVGAIGGLLRAPVLLVGDTTAATVAEFSVARRRACTSGVYVTVSTGIGMGMLFNGRVYTGHRGAAGELGHTPVSVRDPIACRCGQRGCLEAYASGWGLVDRAIALLATDSTGSVLAASARTGDLTARAIVEAAATGDSIARDLIDEAVELLATAIATIFRMLGPEVVVLGGGLMQATEVAQPLYRRVTELLALAPGGLDRMLVSAEHGDASALEGARAICRRDPRALAMGDGLTWA